VGGVRLVRISGCTWQVKHRETLGVLITWCMAVVAVRGCGKVMDDEVST
jgi:hypothetical protein